MNCLIVYTDDTGDWVKLGEAEKSELGITLKKGNVEGVSRNVFKHYVNKKTTENHLNIWTSSKENIQNQKC